MTSEQKAKQEEILKSKDPKRACNFAIHVKGADIKALQKVVVESEDSGWAYCFALNVKRADIKALQKVIIESKDPGWAYYFALDVKGVSPVWAASVKAYQASHPEGMSLKEWLKKRGTE